MRAMARTAPRVERSAATGGVPGLRLQRKCAECGSGKTAWESCGACQGTARPLQRRSLRPEGGIYHEAPQIVHEVLNSPGAPLTETARAFFEPRFQHDFSAVRVHMGDKATASALSIGADAYTAGHHIVFAADKWSGNPRDGLLAHELAHVVQQNSLGPIGGRVLAISDSHGAEEQEAQAAARAVSTSSTLPRLPTFSNSSSGGSARIARSLSADAGDKAPEPQLEHSSQSSNASPAAANSENNLNNNDDCPIESAQFTSIPSGKLVPMLESNAYTAAFSMKARFTARDGCTCARGVYRQYVRGSKTYDGIEAPSPRPAGNELRKFKMTEDVDLIGGYGDRSLPAEYTNHYAPDQEGGCEFEGYDAPGLRADGPFPSGMKLKINLHFRGELQDIGDNRILASSRWSVVGKVVVP